MVCKCETCLQREHFSCARQCDPLPRLREFEIGNRHVEDLIHKKSRRMPPAILTGLKWIAVCTSSRVTYYGCVGYRQHTCTAAQSSPGLSCIPGWGWSPQQTAGCCSFKTWVLKNSSSFLTLLEMCCSSDTGETSGEPLHQSWGPGWRSHVWQLLSHHLSLNNNIWGSVMPMQ